MFLAGTKTPEEESKLYTALKERSRIANRLGVQPQVSGGVDDVLKERNALFKQAHRAGLINSLDEVTPQNKQPFYQDDRMGLLGEISNTAKIKMLRPFEAAEKGIRGLIDNITEPISNFKSVTKVQGMGAQPTVQQPIPQAQPTNQPAVQPTIQPTQGIQQLMSVPPTPTPTQRPGDIDPIQYGVSQEFAPLTKRMAEIAQIPHQIAVGILLNENRSQRSDAVNNNSDGSADYGLWQLNGIPEFDPIANTERAGQILAGKRQHLVSMGIQNPALGLLVESYNKGAGGAVSLFDPNVTYARKAFENVGLDPNSDPFLRDPRGYLRQFGY